jgi:hypothetical protein
MTSPPGGRAGPSGSLDRAAAHRTGFTSPAGTSDRHATAVAGQQCGDLLEASPAPSAGVATLTDLVGVAGTRFDDTP